MRHYDWRRFDDKLATVTISRNTGRRLSDRPGEGSVLIIVGDGLRRFGEAITVSQDAAAIFRETGDRHGEGMALSDCRGR